MTLKSLLACHRIKHIQVLRAIDHKISQPYFSLVLNGYRKPAKDKATALRDALLSFGLKDEVLRELPELQTAYYL